MKNINYILFLMLFTLLVIMSCSIRIHRMRLNDLEQRITTIEQVVDATNNNVEEIERVK